MRLPVPNILSVCKAEEGGDAVASLTDGAQQMAKQAVLKVSLLTGRSTSVCRELLPAIFPEMTIGHIDYPEGQKTSTLTGKPAE